MSSFILFNKGGQILGGNSGPSVDTSKLLEKTVADVTYVNESGDQMRGPISMNGFALTNLPAAINPNDAVRKQDAVTTSGAIFTADIDMAGFKIKNYGTPSEDHDVTDKTYVEGRLVSYVNANALPKTLMCT